MKVTIVGAGITYTPELVEGMLSREKDTSLDELVLYDIDDERLEIVGRLAERMAVHRGHRGLVRRTLCRDDALDGATFVIVQLRIGGQAARLVDETLPPRFGCVGQETTRPGGFAKALRTVPVVLELAEDSPPAAPPAPG